MSLKRIHMRVHVRVCVCVLVSTVYSALGCVVTGPDQKKVPVGSNVRLSCDLTQCLKSLGHHQISAEWEFIDKGSMDKARHSLIYHYHNQTVTVEPRVSLVGNISEGDFSLLLLSVTVQRSGTYLCRLRSPHGFSDIHESHTQVTVVERSGQHRSFPGDLHKPGVNHPDWLLPLCCVLFSLFLVGGVTVGICVCRRRSPRQQNDKCHIQVNVTRGEDTREANGNKDTNCYVTLQRLRAPPPPTPSRGEGIYVTMHGTPAGPSGVHSKPQTHPSRKTLPEEWRQQEIPTKPQHCP
ncbi:uncharacterized protein LOC109909757 isoform X1 [Oncorhynchus kisutch]|uniref:uncharacterized protein LOC109909757 isoform X1 n=2 Tax=Oncorhynchus kisutch TaxID=8019 RepID=UPI00099F6B5D|nr:uncharacterized protein LOC109909757 isoform X1 [Oncorhynchus kisutch]